MKKYEEYIPYTTFRILLIIFGILLLVASVMPTFCVGPSGPCMGCFHYVNFWQKLLRWY